MATAYHMGDDVPALTAIQSQLKDIGYAVDVDGYYYGKTSSKTLDAFEQVAAVKGIPFDKEKTREAIEDGEFDLESLPVYTAIKEFTESNPQSYGASIAIDWSVNLYLETNGTYKKRLVKPEDFQIDKRTRYPVILTINDSERVHFYNNAHIWFPCVYKHNDNLRHAKKNITLFNKALELLDKALKPKDIDFEPSEFNGARVFKHGLKIQKEDCWCFR